MSKKVLAFVGVIVMLMQFALPVFAADADVATEGDVVVAAGEPVITLAEAEEGGDGGLDYKIAPTTEGTEYDVQLSLNGDTKAAVATQTDITASGTELNGNIPANDLWGNSGTPYSLKSGESYVARVRVSGTTDWSAWSAAADASYFKLASPTDVLLENTGAGGVKVTVTAGIDNNRSNFKVKLLQGTTEAFVSDPEEDDFESVGGDKYAFTIEPSKVKAGREYRAEVIAVGSSQNCKDSDPVLSNKLTASGPQDTLEFGHEDYYVPAGNYTATLTDLDLLDLDISAEDESIYGELENVTFTIGDRTVNNEPTIEKAGSDFVLTVEDGVAGQNFEVIATTQKENLSGKTTVWVGSIEPWVEGVDFQLYAGSRIALDELALRFTPADLFMQEIKYSLGEGEDGFNPATYFEIDEDTYYLELKSGADTSELVGKKFTVIGSTGIGGGITFTINVEVTEPVLDGLETKVDDIGILLSKNDGKFEPAIADLLSTTPEEIKLASVTDLMTIKSSNTAVATVSGKVEGGKITITGKAPGKTMLTFSVGYVSAEIPVYVSDSWDSKKPVIQLSGSTPTDLEQSTTYSLGWKVPDGMTGKPTIFNARWDSSNPSDFYIASGKLRTSSNTGATGTVTLYYDYVTDTGTDKVADYESTFTTLRIKAKAPTAVRLFNVSDNYVDGSGFTLNQYDVALPGKMPATTTTDLFAKLNNDDGGTYKYEWESSDETIVGFKSTGKDPAKTFEGTSDTGEHKVELVAGAKYGKKATITVVVKDSKDKVINEATTTVTLVKGVDTIVIKNVDKYINPDNDPYNYNNKINVGKAVTFYAELNKDGTAPKDKTVFWEISGTNSSVTPTASASITDAGKFTAIAPGTVYVRPVSQDARRTPVKPETGWLKLEIVQPATSITAKTANINLPLDSKVTLGAELMPDNVSGSVKVLVWDVKSGNAKIESGSTVIWKEGAAVGNKAVVEAREPYTNKYVTFNITAVDPFGATQTDITKKGNIIPDPLLAGRTVDLGKDVKYTPENPANKNIEWTSSDTRIASVSAKGVVKALNSGEVTITARVYNQTAFKFGGAPNLEEEWTINVSKPITKVAITKDSVVTKAIEVSNLVKEVELGSDLSPDGSNKASAYTWTVKEPSIATTSDIGFEAGNAKVIYKERLGATKAASTTLTVEAKDAITNNVKKSAAVKITSKTYAAHANSGDFYAITPATLNIAQKKSINLSVGFAAGITEKGVTWTSNSPSVAKVDAKGKVTGVSVGTATITATPAGSNLPGGHGPIDFTVNVGNAANGASYAKGVGILQGNFKGIKDATYALYAYPTSGGADFTVVWSSSNENVVQIVSPGTGLANSSAEVKVVADSGSAKITAKDVTSGKSKTITITAISASAATATPPTISLAMPANKTNKNVFKPATTDPNTAVFVNKPAKFTAKVTGNANFVEWSVDDVTDDGSTESMSISPDGTVYPSAVHAGRSYKVTATIRKADNSVLAEKSSEIFTVVQLVEDITITGAKNPDGSRDSSYITFAKGTTVSEVELNVKLNEFSVGGKPHWDDYTKTTNEGGPAQFSWKSSNVGVASLDFRNGDVYVKKGAKAGTTTITLTALDGSKTTGSIKVTNFSTNSANEFLADSIVINKPKNFYYYLNVGKATKFTATLSSESVTKGSGNKLASSEIAWEISSSYGATMKASKASATVTSRDPGENITLTAYYVADPSVRTSIDFESVTPVTKVEMNQSKVTVAKGGEVTVSARINTSKQNTDNLDWSVSDSDRDKYNIEFDDTDYDTETGYYYANISVGNIPTSASGITVTAKNWHSGKKATFKLVIADSYEKPASVSLSESYRVLAVGKTFKLKATVNDAEGKKAANQNVVWVAVQDNGGSYEPASNITVDKNGTVKALGTSSDNVMVVAIPAEYQDMSINDAIEFGFAATCEVVVGFPITKVAAVSKSLVIDGTSGNKFNVKITPFDATLPMNGPSMNWTSSDPSVCTAKDVVDGYDETTGTLKVQVYPNKTGKATLTGVTMDGSNKKVSVTVTVKSTIS